jgi:hydroxymethylglutaryl-CoA synthase
LVGIVAYGVYIPRWRITVDEIARVWGHDAERYRENLLIQEKAVPALDEDTATLAVEAARNALRRAPEVNPKEIGALYVGSESHPYAVKPTATIVAEAIDATPALTAADLEFACKAGTAAIQACMGLVAADYIRYGLAIGADTAQAQPADALEYAAAAGAAAVLVGREGVIAEIEGTYSYTQDVPDFWRRDGAAYPRHGGRFTGEEGYFRQVVNCTRGLMARLGTTPRDYDYVVFHQPNGKFPRRAAELLGFRRDQVEPGLVVTAVGNTYSASSLLGLAAVLDEAAAGSRILMTSYGSGAGSDAFSLVVTDQVAATRRLAPSVAYYVQRRTYIDYAQYSKFKQQIRGFGE